jgi:hypothetical protein
MSYSPGPGFIRTSGWGYRSSGFHSGVDYQARIGTPIRAADHGAVHAVRWHETYGNMVICNTGLRKIPGLLLTRTLTAIGYQLLAPASRQVIL